jgi:hypothetical protein
MLSFFLVLSLAPFVLAVWTAIDASHFPDWAFERAASSKTLWVVLPLVSLVACFFGAVVVALIWFGSTRGRVAAATRQIPPQASPPLPPPPGSTWQPPPQSRPW